MEEGKKCKCCGKVKPLSEYRKDGGHHLRTSCNECALAERTKRKFGYSVKYGEKYYDLERGRTYVFCRGNKKIFWDENMLRVLREEYPRCHTNEVAELCGVSRSTVINKARELGIKKSRAYIKREHQKSGFVGAYTKLRNCKLKQGK
jgi:hypothetical protein